MFEKHYGNIGNPGHIMFKILDPTIFFRHGGRILYIELNPRTCLEESCFVELKNVIMRERRQSQGFVYGMFQNHLCLILWMTFFVAVFPTVPQGRDCMRSTPFC